MGHITADDLNTLQKGMEDKIAVALRTWGKAAQSQWDRCLLAKSMALSKLWYLASVIPWDTKSLELIEKMANNYIWSNGYHKVSKRQLMLPRPEGGLGCWNLVAKVRALNSTWGYKKLTGEMGGALKHLLHVLSYRQYTRVGTKTVDIWRSGALPGDFIRKTLKAPTLAYLLDNWNRGYTRQPKLLVGDWVLFSYEDGTIDNGRGQVTRVTSPTKAEVAWEPFPIDNTVPPVAWRCKSVALWQSKIPSPAAVHNSLRISGDGIDSPEGFISLRAIGRMRDASVEERGPSFL